MGSHNLIMIYELLMLIHQQLLMITINVRVESYSESLFIIFI